MTFHNYRYNPATKQTEAAPIDRGAWNAWFADIEAQRVADQAISRRVNGQPRRRPITGTLPCHHCEGLGFIQYDAGFTETMAVCDCSHCGGTGWRK